MIQEGQFSTKAIKGQLYNPWSRRTDTSLHWGPVAIQDPSQGLGVKLWRARAIAEDVLISAPGVAEFSWYTHTSKIKELSLAFDQNARVVLAFVDSDGGVFMRWFDPVPNAIVDFVVPGVSPRVTLDDNRPFNGANSDVILGYVRAGVLRYRKQRDRFTIEYTPTEGVGGPQVYATGLRHISMNSHLRVEFMTNEGGGKEDWTLPEIVADIAARSNIPANRINVGALDPEKIVRGYTIGGSYAASGILQTLSAVSFFDPYSADGKVNFMPRGRDAEATILDGDMIDDGGDVEDSNTRRGDSISIPRVLHLNYYDVAGGLNTDKQHSERPEGTRAEGEMSLQSPVVMSADEAATVVKITHGLIVEQQKGELNFSLPDSWLSLTEADPVLVQTGTKIVRAIISKVETDDGEQAYTAIRDRQSLYSTQVQGIPSAPVTRPPSSVAGPTILQFLDIPILRDSHDMLGFYLAVSGILPAWPGASVDLSIDGGANYIESQTTRSSSVIGTLVTALGDHPFPYPDAVNSCQVAITTPNALLESATLAGMMNRRNRVVIGNEIINFGDSDEVTQGVWELSNFLRGRLGTATDPHAIGERFVMLDTALFIPAELSWLNRTLTFRATTFGRPADEATITTVIFTGQSQVERQPAYLQARRSGTDAVIGWQGVGRLGGGANVAMGSHFAGFRITITGGSVTQTFDQLQQSLTTPLAAFAGPVTVPVQQRNNFTGLGPAIEVTI